MADTETQPSEPIAPAIPGIPTDMTMTVDARRTGPCAPGEKPM